MTTKNRWAIYNKNTFAKTGYRKLLRSYASREYARLSKKDNEGIYDTLKRVAIR